jgi:hypothetical protein
MQNELNYVGHFATFVQKIPLFDPVFFQQKDKHESIIIDKYYFQSNVVYDDGNDE